MNILIIIALSLLTLISGLITWLGISGPVILGVVTLLWGYFTHFESVSVGQVIVVWVVAGGLELVEFFLGGIAARNYGASSRSMWLAILGGILEQSLAQVCLCLSAHWWGYWPVPTWVPISVNCHWDARKLKLRMPPWEHSWEMWPERH